MEEETPKKERKPPVQFIQVTKEFIFSFLEKAKKRIVIAKAGYFVDEVEFLLSLMEKNEKLRCDVFVDTREKTIRYGFGEKDALALLDKNQYLLNVQGANFIRLAFVIVDESIIVYSPVALSWEEAPENIDFPNGFIGKKALATSLLRQIDGETDEIEEEITIEGMDIVVQSFPIPKKEPEDLHYEVEETLANLEKNPPVDPARLRKTTFYRNKYKILRKTVSGVRLTTKSISLRNFTKMLPKASERLRSSWNVLTGQDMENFPVIKDFLSAVENTTAGCTYDAKRFGTLIEVKDIRTYEHCITFLVYDLIYVLLEKGKKDQPENSVEKSIISLLQESRTALIDHLFSQVKDEKDCWKVLFKNDRSLQRKMMDGEVSQEEAIKLAVESFVDYELSFPNAEQLIERIHVEFDYYDISDELLAKDEFFEIIENLGLVIREYEDGFKEGSPKP